MRPLRTLPLIGLVALVSACAGDEQGVVQTGLPEIVRTEQTVTLYFESPGLRLAAEERTMQLPEEDWAAAPLILGELVKGSVNEGVPALLPPDTEIRSVYFLPAGAVVVDLGGPTLSQGWNTGSHMELMAVYSVVQTIVSNFGGVVRVRVLVNGQPAPTLGGHVAIDRFLKPRPDLVVQR